MAPPRSPALVYTALAGGVIVVSGAAILIRLAQAEGMSSLAIATGRLLLASALLLPFALRPAAREFARLSRRDAVLMLASGACLAVHFAAWIASLRYTSVASSTALVTTNPVWVGLASVLLLRESLTRSVLIGIALAVAGTLVMFLAQGEGDSGGAHTTLGNGLALLGALSASAYLIIGRAQRERVSLMAYVAVVYSVAGLLLLVAALIRGETFLGLSATAYACVIGLAIGPQLIGHTILNWSVRQVSATLVALTILGEPLGSSLLAYLLLKETIGWAQGAAFALILVGIFFAAHSPVRRAD